MATFLVLPPRELLEHAVADFLTRTLPAVPIPNDLLAGVFSRLAAEGSGTFIVHREDLSDSADLEGDLCAAFGAEPGDRIVEIGPPRAGARSTVRESLVTGPVSAAAAAR